jgi:hypothetical protein
MFSDEREASLDNVLPDCSASRPTVKAGPLYVPHMRTEIHRFQSTCATGKSFCTATRGARSKRSVSQWG